MERLTKWEDLIERILEKYMAARSDDRVLYYWILRELGFDTGISLSFFLLSEGYPNFETVTRVRRKVQKKHPELLPPENTQVMRMGAEEDYKQYARA